MHQTVSHQTELNLAEILCNLQYGHAGRQETWWQVHAIRVKNVYGSICSCAIPGETQRRNDASETHFLPSVLTYLQLEQESFSPHPRAAHICCSACSSHLGSCSGWSPPFEPHCPASEHQWEDSMLPLFPSQCPCKAKVVSAGKDWVLWEACTLLILSSYTHTHIYVHMNCCACIPNEKSKCTKSKRTKILWKKHRIPFRLISSMFMYVILGMNIWVSHWVV